MTLEPRFITIKNGWFNKLVYLMADFGFRCRYESCKLGKVLSASLEQKVNPSSRTNAILIEAD